MKKWLKITLIIVASLLGLLFLALLLVSPIAKGYVNKHGKELIGREIHVEKLRANALAGRVRIYDMTVYEDDDTTAFFSFDTLDVSVKLRKLLRSELYVRHITLSGPRVKVIQNKDRFNFSSIIDHFSSDEEEPDTDTTSSDWKFGFYNIRLSDGEVYYADAGLGSEWDLKNLNVKIPGVYFDGAENTDAGLALQLADGGVLRTEASMNMDNNDFKVNLQLEKFAISNAKAYLADVMSVGKMEGLLDADIKVDGNLSDIMKMIIRGKLTLSGVEICDKQNESVASFNKLAIVLNKISLAENLYDIKSVALNGLSSHFDIYSDGNNFSRLFASSSSSENDDEPEAVEVTENANPVESKPFKLNVGSFAVNDAEFTFNDNTLPDHFSFPVKKINIAAENISSSGDNNARVIAQLPHGGTMMVRWHGNIDNWKQNQNLMLNIRNLQLKDLSPYSVAYLGAPFTDGTFSFTSDNRILYSQLEGNNKIDLFNPEVGEKRKDVDAEVNIPLKAAIYVLKDKDGKVELDIPVKGNIDSPEFSYMKMVWKTLGNLLVKVATSPFRAVAKALGQTGELDFIAYNPLDVHFSSEQYSVLNKIVDVLKYDTSITITLVPQINMQQSCKQQSLYLLKEEYYMTKHPDKAKSAIFPQVYLYDEVGRISVKDTGFVAFLQRKGISSRKPSDKDVQRLAEKLYSRDAAQSSLEILAGYRNDFIKKFFSDQGIIEKQLVIGPIDNTSDRSGYVINSEMTNEDMGDGVE
ncbi:MAG: DUF748 domain-containing protein [Bacteroidales bacterium]|nr:DUF748 domain-containing protein [Bacteroidales bacterium]